MRIPDPNIPDDDFLFTVADTASFLRMMSKDVYAIGAKGELGEIKNMIAKENGRGQPKRFFSLRSILEYAKTNRIMVSVRDLERVTDDSSVIGLYEDLSRALGLPETPRVTPTKEQGTPKNEPQEGGVIEQLKERLAEKNIQVADLQRRLDEKDEKAETLLIGKMNAEKSLANLSTKVQVVDPSIKFLPVRNEGGVVIDVEVVRDVPKRSWWQILTQPLG